MKIYKTEQIEQGSQEWLALRAGKFTASKALPIATNGSGLETLCFALAAEILMGKPIETYKNEAMENGNNTEDEARAVYELQSGLSVEQVGFVELDEFIGASPDGIVGKDGLLEIKCPTARVFCEYLYNGKIKNEYLNQMQMQIYVTGRKWVDFVVYHPDFKPPIIVKRVEKDEKMIEKIKIGLENGKNKIKEILEKIKYENIQV